MTAILKNMYFDIVEYNNTYHKTVKMKATDVKRDFFAEYN